MANPLRYQQYSVTATAGEEITVNALQSISGTKQTVHKIYITPTANVDLIVFEGQTKAIDMPSVHVPSEFNAIDIDIDVDAAQTVAVGVRNNTAGTITQVITVEYDYGT